MLVATVANKHGCYSTALGEMLGDFPWKVPDCWKDGNPNAGHSDKLSSAQLLHRLDARFCKEQGWNKSPTTDYREYFTNGTLEHPLLFLTQLGQGPGHQLGKWTR